MKNIYFIIVAVSSFFYVIIEVRKKRFSIKESFWWVIASIVMIILAIFPHLIDNFAHMLGIDYPPSLLFLICIMFLAFINFKSSRKITMLQEKVIEMAEHITLLEGDDKK